MPLIVEWADVEGMAIVLGDRLKADDFIPDFVVGISRGGYFPAILINLRVCEGWAPTCYFDIKRDAGDEKVRIVENSTFSPEVDLTGKRVLLCEDMLETGESLRVAKEWLGTRGAQVRTLSLFARPDAAFKPDYLLQILGAEPSFPWGRFRERLSLTQLLAKVDRNLVIEAVCERTRVSRALIFSRTRDRRVSYARHLAMYLLAVISQETTAEISRLFKRDHSTVIAGIRRIDIQSRVDAEVKEEALSVARSLVTNQELRALLEHFNSRH